MNDGIGTRRDFLRASGGALGAAWLGAHWPAIAAAAEHAHEAASGAVDYTLRLLDAAQARDVEAVASQIVPSGDTPGAREAGVVYFVDHVLTGIFAADAAQFLEGLRAFQQGWSTANPGAGPFADADTSRQVAYLKSVENTPFFQAMRFFTIAGLLALPSYGGNRDKLGWKMVGFVDQHVWSPPFGHYDAEYAGFVPYDKESRS
jgi:gluconate 2-dehydrogenase gamma chain